MKIFNLIIGIVLGVLICSALHLYQPQWVHDFLALPKFTDAEANRTLLTTAPTDQTQPRQTSTQKVHHSAKTTGIVEPESEALSKILSPESLFSQAAALYDLIKDASADELDTLLEDIRRSLYGARQMQFSAIIYRRYAELDPQRALTKLKQANTSPYQHNLLAIFFSSWYKLDETAALEAARGLNTYQKRFIFSSISQSSDGFTRVQTQELAQALNIPMSKQSLDMMLLQRQSRDDPARALNQALQLSNKQARSQQLTMIVARWASSDGATAMNAIQGLEDGKTKDQLISTIVSTWSQTDPQAAMDWTLAQPPSTLRGRLLSSALAGWAAENPTGAIDMAATIDREDERNRAFSNILATWAQHDVRAAADWLTSNTLPGKRQQLNNSVTQAYISQFPHEAISWIDTLASKDANQARRAAINMLSHSDPEQASVLVGDITDSTLRQQATTTLVSQWAQHEPEVVANWIASQDLENAGVHYRQLVMSWSNHDKQGAMNFVNTIDSKVHREQATVGLIQALRGEPDMAERLFDSLTTEDSRMQAAQILSYQLSRSGDAKYSNRANRYKLIVKDSQAQPAAQLDVEPVP